MVLLIFIFLWTALSAAPFDNYRVTRDYIGDVFALPDEECGKSACERDGRFAAPVPGDGCACQCAPSHYIYRDDIEDCVEYVAECPLAVFLRPFMSEKLPVVSLPLTGQLVYPGAHFQFPDIGNMSSLSTCEVSNTEYMTSKGWIPVTQDDGSEPVFGVFQDSGNTFLQWLGRDNQRIHLQHHLVLIRLRCQDQDATFDSCSALRIGWSPGLNAALTEPFWIRRNNFIIIGLCVGILGLTYVFAICIYMKVRRRKAKKCNSGHFGGHPSAFRDLRNKKDSHKVPQVYNVMERDLWIHQKNCLKAEKYPSSTYITGRKPKEEIETGTNDSYLARQNFVLGKEYFEPEMLASPPPLATELLHRVRQTISLTMRRIRNLKYRPTLVIIPEEDYFDPNEQQKNTALSTETHQEPKLETITGLSKVPASITDYSLSTPRPPPRKCRSKKLDEIIDDSILDENSNQLTKFDQFRQDLYQKVNKLNDMRNKLDTVHVLEGEEDGDFDGLSTTTRGANRISRRTLLTHIEADLDDEGSVSNKDDEKSLNNDLEEITIEDNNTNNQVDVAEKEANELIEDYLSLDIEELYRQWSNQLALKLLEQKIPNIECNVEEKETNVLTHFLKEFRNAFGRHLNLPKSHDLEPQLQRDNWTLRKERDSERSSALSSRMSDASTFRLDSLTDFSESSIEGQTSQDSLTNSEELRPEVETSGVSSGGDEPLSLDKSSKLPDINDFCSQQSIVSSANTSSVDIDSLEDSDNSFGFNSSSDVSDMSSNEDDTFTRGNQNLKVRKELKAVEWKHVCERKHQEEEAKNKNTISKQKISNKKQRSLCKNKRPVNGTCKDYIRYCKSSRTGMFSPSNIGELSKNDTKQSIEHCVEDDCVTLIGIGPSK